MGKQTFVLLRCCDCGLFQAHIDKQSRKFTCVVCQSAQQYSRVFAKSRLAKDIRPLAAEYNKRGITEQAVAGDCTHEGDGCASECAAGLGSCDPAEGCAGATGFASCWEEFAVEEAPRVEGAPSTAETDVPFESAWEQDSDAKRALNAQVRQRKKPRIAAGQKTNSARDKDECSGAQTQAAAARRWTRKEVVQETRVVDENANTMWDDFLSEEDALPSSASEFEN
jgi:hypothetical protein